MQMNRLSCLLVVFVLASASVLGQSRLRLEMVDYSLPPSGQIQNYSSDQMAEKSNKSVLLAIGYSLVLPGLGEYYADNFATGKYFLGADAGLWLTYGGFRAYGQWLKDDAKTLAAQKASADFSGKDDKFEVNLGNFGDVISYNDAKLRNREYDLLYDPKSTFSWQWSSDVDRLHYKDLRNRGESTLRSSEFVLGALILNRVISAISAARSVLVYNRSIQALGSWRMSATVPGGMLAADGIELTLTREF